MNWQATIWSFYDDTGRMVVWEKGNIVIATIPSINYTNLGQVC